ncbi:dsRBD fold-containing protein [Pseudonocardia sp. CA-107938]|uniref:dsRBD fold-containing protein n=1 Tax=Pseudonocardia sp. CA-107938 TaxID=3240021 RepID=UPI003D8CD194
MDGVTRWTIVVDISHVDGLTCAGAHLYERESDALTGRGIVLRDGGSTRSPRAVAALATAQALVDLAARLRQQVADQAVAPSCR